MKTCSIHGTPLNGNGDCFPCTHPEAVPDPQPTAGVPMTPKEKYQRRRFPNSEYENLYTIIDSLRAELARAEAEMGRLGTELVLEMSTTANLQSGLARVQAERDELKFKLADQSNYADIYGAHLRCNHCRPASEASGGADKSQHNGS